MKRQRIRKALILISFLLFPVTLNYFSPALIIEGAAKGIVVGSFIIFTALFFFALFLGRAFCGWLCPGAGLQEACFVVQDKTVKGGKRNWIKYFIWVPWITTIAFFAIRAGGLHSIKPFYQMESGISVTDPFNYVIFYIVILLIAVPAFVTGRRAFCHRFCWMAPFMVIGDEIGRLLKLPGLRLTSDRNKCVSCRTCTKKCPMSLDVNQMVQRGSMTNSECILCGTCVDGCSKGAIAYSFSAGKQIAR
ncbi:MAG TPA: 4Fe-4S dicluster domain-containing protein [Candidatus Aquicultor sp.]|jgi:polyferredoxin